MLKLVQIDNGVFDLAFDDPALADEDAAVATLVYAVLFSDSEAPPERVSDRYERRGWWADPEAGSGLWHVRRQPLGSAARRETLAMIENALTSHGLAGVQVTEQADSAGNVSSVLLQVTGRHNGRNFTVKVPL
ncbi:phage GP46 family protein [Candidatus Ferrigenium straubiae]|jgi:phage gp46-like protein|uniref:phage GP46 family protein n=1 Tax=Candidatus Ferrigenium straubiae TaxID=2919506 RepID=UPI003F4A9BE3